MSQATRVGPFGLVHSITSVRAGTDSVSDTPSVAIRDWPARVVPVPTSIPKQQRSAMIATP